MGGLREEVGGGGWKRFELLEAGFEIGGERGVGEVSGVEGGDLFEGAEVGGFSDEGVDCGTLDAGGGGGE